MKKRVGKRKIERTRKKTEEMSKVWVWWQIQRAFFGTIYVTLHLHEYKALTARKPPSSCGHNWHNIINHNTDLHRNKIAVNRCIYTYVQCTKPTEHDHVDSYKVSLLSTTIQCDKFNIHVTNSTIFFVTSEWFHVRFSQKSIDHTYNFREKKKNDIF